MASTYDDRPIRITLDRIAHALEAIARSKDPSFKTQAEARAEAKPAATGGEPAAGGRSKKAPWIRRQKRSDYLDRG